MPTLNARLIALALTVIAGVAGAVYLVFQSSPASPPPTSSTTTTTTTTEPLNTSTSGPHPTTTTPTTTTGLGAVSPINGLPVDDPALLARRVLAVKVDNHPSARPHSGVEQADMVIELMVEGITRFIAVWQQSDVDYLGPVRSGRPTDPTLLAAFNEPTFAISGAQAWVQSVIRSHDVHLIGEVRPATFRISERRAPHNLYADTLLLREYAETRGYPDEPPAGPIWAFGSMPENATPATSVQIDFSGDAVAWTWDEETQTYLRAVNGVESEWTTRDGESGVIGFPVLVALYTDQYTARPPGGTSGKPVPASQTIGEGKAFVFAAGRVVEGTWHRDSEQEWFTLTDADGNVIEVPAGQVWISLVPSTQGVTYDG